MTLTLEELEGIQADCMADDIALDFEKMSMWTKEQAISFFETGEEPPPPWEPEPYLMGRLDKEGLSHLKEHLREQTVAGLVDLMKTDRPKFLPTLQKLGVSKLPDRQKVRDIINFIANPPVGSEDKLREEYKAEFEIWPWAVVQSEKNIVTSEVDTMVSKLPGDRPLKKYLVRNLDKGAVGVSVQQGRSSISSAVGTAGLIFDNGEIIVGDEESWSVTHPSLRVHVFVENKVQASMGYLQGWVDFVHLVPLDDNGEPPKKVLDANGKSSYAIQRKIQEYAALPEPAAIPDTPHGGGACVSLLPSLCVRVRAGVRARARVPQVLFGRLPAALPVPRHQEGHHREARRHDLPSGPRPHLHEGNSGCPWLTRHAAASPEQHRTFSTGGPREVCSPWYPPRR